MEWRDEGRVKKWSQGMGQIRKRSWMWHTQSTNMLFNSLVPRPRKSWPGTHCLHMHGISRKPYHAPCSLCYTTRSNLPSRILAAKKQPIIFSSNKDEVVWKLQGLSGLCKVSFTLPARSAAFIWKSDYIIAIEQPRVSEHTQIFSYREWNGKCHTCTNSKYQAKFFAAWVWG